MERVSADQNHSFPDGFGEEADVVYLAAEDISEGIQTCHKSLVGKMFSDRSFSIGTIEVAMTAIWGRPEGFQRWKESATLGELKVLTFPVWAQLWGLPEQFKILEESRIIKLKIEIDGLKRAKDNLKLAGPDKFQKEVGLRYERLEIVCTYCAHIGHKARHCQLFLQHSYNEQIQQDAIGEWVKAHQIGRIIERKAETNSDSRKFPM
ncbi:hypothetical protein PIB30_107417 [Stylosanthes scabra]|uniref:Zinc knuckle CX2CX4HX4C domain-containing protein n=1 Tax=Stylosanthes scabra TaxID=79078 RepID=A0ABU6SZK5_9FABA|nr:hypothetical protein [Stylosanthes scabra]